MWVRLYSPVLLVLANLLRTSCEGTASLTFVIDDTLSMGDEISQVKNTVNGIMDVIFERKASLIQNMVLVTFNDPDVHLRASTTKRSEINHALEHVKVHNSHNWDWEEMSLTGVLKGLHNSLPGSFLYVFTDADPKDYNRHEEVKQLCQKKRTQIVFVITESYSVIRRRAAYQIYYDIAAACSGTVFVCPDKNITPVIDVIKEVVQNNQTLITSVTTQADKTTDIPFNIDDQTDSAIVTATGENVKLSINVPTNIQQVLVWDKDKKVVKLNNPSPGRYIATTSADSSVSFQIFGKTEFFFKHGFSELEPKYLSDTSPQTIADTLTRLSVLISDPKEAVQIQYAQILTEDQKLITQLPLKLISKDFYTTDPFIAPSNKFKIAVFGTIKSTGKTIIRYADRPIIPQIPPKPDNMAAQVTIAEGKSTEVEYRGSIKLTCRIYGYPPPTITWTNSRGAVLPSQSSLIQKPYEYISYLEIKNVVTKDKYSCSATNYASDTKSIEVLPKSPFRVKSTTQGNLNVAYASIVTLTCHITSSLPMSISWYYANENGNRKISSSEKYFISSDGTQLQIKKMDLDLVGRYTCDAALSDDDKVHQTYSTMVKVVGLVVPVLKGEVTKKVIKHTDITLSCNVIKGSPKPKLTWYFKGKVVGSGTVLSIPKVEAEHSGTYRCVADNVAGSAHQDTELQVEFTPSIIKHATKYKAVEGDVGLQIPCNAVGVPKPVITWTWDLEKSHGAKDGTDGLHVDNEGTLNIKNVSMKHKGKYTCHATNHLGADHFSSVVKVSSMPHNDGSVHYINLLPGQSTVIPCGDDSSSKSVRWFMELPNYKCENTKRPDLEATTTPRSDETTRNPNDDRPSYNCLVEMDVKVVNITDATKDNNGRYICRASDAKGGRTETYIVTVGNRPQFSYEVDSLVEWNGEDRQILDCDTKRVLPTPKVQWTYNGKILPTEISSQLDASSKWGHYTCNVSNVHGYVERSFDVVSSVCIIDKTNIFKNNENVPLILSPEQNWPTFTVHKDFMIINNNEEVVFSCPKNKNTPNGFVKFPALNKIKALCNKQDIYSVDGKEYKLSDLRCTHELQPVVIKTGNKCFTDNSELINVGFDVDGHSKFLETYQVCFDHSNNMPLYSRANIFDRRIKSSHRWYKHPEIGSDKERDNKYTCVTENQSCCYGKTLLVNSGDFEHVAAQNSAFIEPLNAVPGWRPCKSNTSWEIIEDSISEKSKEFETTVAWSGVHMLQRINGGLIPRYLWKVVRLEDEDPIAVVYVNNASPTNQDVLCKNICDQNYNWLKLAVQEPEAYCCNLNDFLKAFNLKETTVGASMRGTTSQQVKV